MNNNNIITDQQKYNKIYDYIFLSFFLGNDFLPHFPAVNIRTGGMDKLLNAYRETIGKTNEVLTDGTKIYWNNIRKLIQCLANNEEAFLKEEYIIFQSLNYIYEYLRFIYLSKLIIKYTLQFKDLYLTISDWGLTRPGHRIINLNI